MTFGDLKFFCFNVLKKLVALAQDVLGEVSTYNINTTMNYKYIGTTSDEKDASVIKSYMYVS